MSVEASFGDDVGDYYYYYYYDVGGDCSGTYSDGHDNSDVSSNLIACSDLCSLQ